MLVPVYLTIFDSISLVAMQSQHFLSANPTQLLNPQWHVLLGYRQALIVQPPSQILIVDQFGSQHPMCIDVCMSD